MTTSYSVPRNICSQNVNRVFDYLFDELDAKYEVDFHIGHVVGVNVVDPIANYIFAAVDEVEGIVK